MAYARAVVLGVVAAVLLGSASGLVEGIQLLPPEHKAVVYAASISSAANCTVIYALVMIPAAVAVAWVRRRRRRPKS